MSPRILRSALAFVALLAAGCSAAPGPQPTSSDAAARRSANRPATSTTTTSVPVSSGWWRPTTGTTWQWQLNTGAIDTTVDAAVYDVDLFDVPASTVAALHAAGRKVICYFTVGSWEPYRQDVATMPASVKGKTVDGWPQERWLDIRRIDVIGPYMANRLDLCKQKGFDGVEGDWMDNHTQDTGFPITSADQLAYNRWLIDQAHARGLAMGVKNDLDQASVLSREADYSINEQCAEFDECNELTPWITAGKPVFHTEYNRTPAQFCPVTQPLRFSSLYKHLELDAWRQTC